MFYVTLRSDPKYIQKQPCPQYTEVSSRLCMLKTSPFRQEQSQHFIFMAAQCASVSQYVLKIWRILPGRVAQSVTCLATDACLTADPGVASSIPARSHTFVEIDHEIISTVILLPSADSFKKGCCQLQAKVCAQITCPSLPRKKCG